MHRHRAFALVACTLTTLTTLAVPGLAQAVTAQCMSALGSCEVSNDGFDWTECTCADGSGIGGGGSNMWAGLSEVELGPICEEQLNTFCAPFVPPEYVECWSIFGYCHIDNEPEDSLECECQDGNVGGSTGGMVWAGYDDMQLYAECEAQLDSFCLAPPMSIECSNANGECTVANVPQDFLGCECLDGGAGVLSGGNAWAGYDELQLFDECGNQLVGLCGGALPLPPWVECSSTLGECIIDNDPEGLECTCANGEVISSGGGNGWAGLSNDELFMVCEEQLYEGCFVEAESESGSDSGDSGDAGSTSSGSSTGEPGEDTGIDDSGDASAGSSGTPHPTTTGDETTGGTSEGSDGGAGGSGGGSSCSATGQSKPGGWALALLGLVGVAWRRRAARADGRQRA